VLKEIQGWQVQLVWLEQMERLVTQEQLERQVLKAIQELLVQRGI
jgi:hypothetical protein